VLGRVLQGEIEDLIRRRHLRGLRAILESLEPADVAEILEDLPDEDVAVVFRTAPRDLAAEVFAELGPAEQEDLLHRLPQERAAEIVASLPPDERTAALDDLPPEVTRRLLEALPPEELETARRLLAYPEESVGRMMTPRVLAVSQDLAAREALERVRASRLPHDHLRAVYLLEADGRLAGVVSVVRILQVDPAARLGDVCVVREPAALLPTDDREEAVRIARRYDLVAVPVVDESRALLGAVTVDDLLDVQVEEATEDIHRIGGVVGVDPERRYLDQGAWAHVRARAPWVAVLALFGILSGEIIARFGAYIEKYVILVVFMPMLAGTGGNVGTQAATVVIRALALDEVRPALRDLVRILRKELAVALGIAAAVGAVVFLRVLLYAATHGEAPLWDGHDLRYVGLVIAVAMMLQVVSSTLFGAAAPLAARAARLDPAVVASPAIATFVDVTGLLIYFLTARAMLGL
jgi:magnesium transporter